MGREALYFIRIETRARPGSQGSNPGGTIYFSLLQTVQNVSGTISASYLVCAWGFLWGELKVSPSEASHKHPHLLPRLKIRELSFN